MANGRLVTTCVLSVSEDIKLPHLYKHLDSSGNRLQIAGSLELCYVGQKITSQKGPRVIDSVRICASTSKTDEGGIHIH